ncbi:MAG: hypothetical protein ACNI25_05495 [Halarcobacter sp.]
MSYLDGNSSDIKIDKFTFDEKTQNAIKIGYGQIKTKMKTMNMNFVNLDEIFIDRPNSYLDKLHYSYNGKIIFVNELNKKIKNIK